MLARLKEKALASERYTRDDQRKVDLKGLLRKGRSFLSSVTLEGRDEKSEEGSNKSNHSKGSFEPKKRSSELLGDSQDLDNFVKMQEPESPTDVKVSVNFLHYTY